VYWRIIVDALKVNMLIPLVVSVLTLGLGAFYVRMTWLDVLIERR
jgi:hypothetical protein